MIHEKLSQIQQKLKAPKGQFNSFGKYKYRSCEDILEAVKPLLGSCSLVIKDSVEMVGNRFYIKALAVLSDGSSEITSTAYAREPETKKGMDESQITGTASSYARKYALNGLFCIDDTKDADTQDNSEKYITEKEIKVILDYLNSLEIPAEKFCKFFGIDKVESLPASRYNEALQIFKAKGAK